MIISHSKKKEPEKEKKDFLILKLKQKPCGARNFSKFFIFKPLSSLIDRLFTESYERLYRYEWSPSKMKKSEENIQEFIKKLKDNDLYGPYNVLTYMNLIIKEFKKNQSKNPEEPLNPFEDWELPYDICYEPRNKANFFDPRNIGFIKRFASTYKFNILPWSFVYSYADELDDLRKKYISSMSSGFIKSYELIVERKIRVSSNILGDEFKSFCHMHLNIFHSIDSLTNIDQVFSNTVFHPLYLNYMNKEIQFTKYYLRQNDDQFKTEDDFSFPFPLENVPKTQFNPKITSQEKEKQKVQEKESSSYSQPGLSKAVHSKKKVKKKPKK